MPKKINQKIITILLLFLLISCQSKIGNPATYKLYKNQINKGSRIEQITQTYGDYSGNWQDENGNNIYQYSYTKNGYDLISQLPIINHFGWINSENYEVILSFDKNGLLLDQAKFYNRSKSRNSLVCNPDIYSCLRKVY